MAPLVRCVCGEAMQQTLDEQREAIFRCSCGNGVRLGGQGDEVDRSRCAVWIYGVRCGRPTIRRGWAAAEMVCEECALGIVHEALQRDPTREFVLSYVAREEIEAVRRNIAIDEFKQRKQEQEQRKADAEAAMVHVVYYVRLGDNHIKIGTTGRLSERMAELRVANSQNLLAAEPGSTDVERQRHRKFQWLKYRRRREDFAETAKLIEHIDSVRAEWGDPWTLPARLVAQDRGGELESA